MRGIVLLLLAAIVAADVADDCSYVESTRVLVATGRVAKCFEQSPVQEPVKRAIIQTLEAVRDYYPFTDIAQKPPSEPAGYFTKMDFTKGLEDLKKTFENASTISTVYRPTMKLINGFRDGRFSLMVDHVSGQFDNFFATVVGVLPFECRLEVGENGTRLFLDNPVMDFLGMSIADTIRSLTRSGFHVVSIDDIDPIEYLTKFFGDYDIMKSPQASLYYTLKHSQEFPLLKFPLDDIFQTHYLVFSNDPPTKVSFHIGFQNLNVDASYSVTLDDWISNSSIEEEKKAKKAIENFKPRATPQEGQTVFCKQITLDDSKVMNFMEILAFDSSKTYDKNLDTFVQELVECMTEFDKNDAPITVVLPSNGGGSVVLAAAVQALLLPSSDFRVAAAMRKSEVSKTIGPDVSSAYGFALDTEKCDTMSKKEFGTFWADTVVDDFGDGVKHERTKQTLLDMKSSLKKLLPYALKKNVRKPTDIVVVTDGFCFGACALFVDNIIRSGAAIVAGFGATIPGKELFAAGQGTTGVIDPAKMFPELNNMTELYGLRFSTPVFETFDVSADMNVATPSEYMVYSTDVHTGFYGGFVYYSEEHRQNMAIKTSAVHELFKTKCNAKNKRLLLVTDKCSSKESNAVLSGYVCGENGEWDATTCKVATCESGYVVDFANNKCVQNTCDFRNDPTQSSSAKSGVSASALLRPVMSFIAAVFIALYHIIF